VSEASERPVPRDKALASACVPASWVTWRMVRYGSLRKPRYVSELVNELSEVNGVPGSLTYTAELVPAPCQLPVPPLAIEGRPVVTATVLASDHERQAVR